MGCLKLSYYEQENALEVNPNFFGNALEQKSGKPEKRLSSYRYGFNGMEGDDELKGEGNSYTTFYRQLDPRIGRWTSLDPVIQPFQSPYCSMNNNPVRFMDPMGDKVTYENFRSRVRTFIGKFGNKSFRKNFKEFKRDKTNTFHVNYVSDRSNAFEDPNQVGGVAKGEEPNTYTITWTIQKDLELSTVGGTKYDALHEEFYHIDDALGGKVFGGTNEDDFVWSSDGSLSTMQSALNPNFIEVDAWIWRADNSKKLVSSFAVNKDRTLRYPIKENFMQKIKNSSHLESDRRRALVKHLLYSTIYLELGPATDSKGEKVYPENKTYPVDGPYKN